MPIYEYECTHCNEIFEIFNKIDEDCKVSCPKCLGPTKKLISASNFVLKGSGFYVNDYPSKSRRESKKAEKGGPEKGTGDKDNKDNKDNKDKKDKKEDKRAEKAK